MEKSKVYIDTYFRGKADDGEGVYTIVLEFVGAKGIPKTREYVKGITHTTKNRTAMIAVIEALSHFIRACKITVHINNNYIVQSMEQEYKKEKNRDLWVKLIELSEIHETKYMFAQENAYTRAMKIYMEHKVIEFEEDKHAENHS